VSDVNATLPEVEVTAPRDPQISPDATITPTSPQGRSAPRLSRKRIDVTFIKGAETGKFAESGTDTAKLSGLRVSAQVSKVGGASMSDLQLRMWGMTLSKMNDLSTLGLTVEVDRQTLNNTVIVEAGDDDAGMAVVFHGTVWDAFADFQGMPDCAFHVTAQSGLYEAEHASPYSRWSDGRRVGSLLPHQRQKPDGCLHGISAVLFGFPKRAIDWSG